MGVGKDVGAWTRALGLDELCYGREGKHLISGWLKE